MPYNIFQLNREGMPSLLQNLEAKQDWDAKQASINAEWLAYIGGIPDAVPIELELLSETDEGDHIRQHVRYATAYDDVVTAFILKPADIPDDARLPAVLALHPTNIQGKYDVAMADGKKNRTYGIELVKRGYVVLAPDALTAGERIYPGLDHFHDQPFYDQHPQWTTVAKNITDHRQGIDVLQSLDCVDGERIGVIGHSFGAYNAYFLGGVDDRIKAIVSSCGVSPFYGDDHPTHWGVRDWYTHLPKVTEELSQGQVPFDFHEIIALAAPKPYFNYAGQSDRIFPHWHGVASCMKHIYDLYLWLGEEEKFRSYLGAAGHDFPVEMRELAYSFLDRWLKEE